MIVRLRREYGQFITSGAQLMLLFVGAELESRTGWLVCIGLLAAISLVAWRSTLRRRRLIADTPTSRIASAAQGYVELRGNGQPLDESPVFSHLHALPCLWYRYQVEERNGSGDKWRTIGSGESDASFILDDGSARCVVDVEGAEILTRHKETRARGNTRTTEWTLLAGDAIYALGDFLSIGGSTQQLDTESDVKALLAEMKKDQTKLLERFDLDGDGRIDMAEWALARQAARREVEKQHRAARNESDVHTLRRPPAGQLYLISNLDPDKIARRYLYWTAFHLATFFAALGSLPWIWQQTY